MEYTFDSESTPSKWFITIVCQETIVRLVIIFVSRAQLINLSALEITTPRRGMQNAWLANPIYVNHSEAKPHLNTKVPMA